MSTTAVQSSAGLRAGTEVSPRGHIGLIVLGAIASGLLLGLLLVPVVLADAPEHEILGSALFALGAGFVVLAIGSSRFSDQPQAWALRPGVATAVMGLATWGARAQRSHTHARRMGLAPTAPRPRRLVIPRCTPGAPQLVAPRSALPVPARSAARCGWRCVPDRVRSDLNESGA